MLRILFCTNSIGAKGGIEKVTIVKANAFAGIDGVDVAICFTDRGTYPDDLIHPLSPKVKVIDLGVTFWDLYPLNMKNLLIMAPGKFMRLRKVLKNVICDFRPDIVISTGSYEKYALATIDPASLTGGPCAKVREYHFNSNYRSMLPRRSIVGTLAEKFEHKVLGRMFDMNYLLTREDKDTNFRGRKGFDYQYNPVAIAPGGRTDVRERDKAVITVCRLTDQKNVHATIRAWAMARSDTEGWVLRIVGDGDQHAELKKIASELGVADSVEFLGFRKDVGKLLRRSRVLAMTSRYEGFGLNIIEAMACGAVPVAYRTPYGPADIITDGIDGFLVDYMDERQMAYRLHELMNNPDLNETMSIAAMERARDFSTDKIAAEWLAKYRGLLMSLRNFKTEES